MDHSQENAAREPWDVRLLGRMGFGDCLELMEDLHGRVAAGSHLPVILVVEHSPVVTMGQRKLLHDLHFAPGLGRPQGFDYFEIDRGGSATAHEPGQIVVYPILPLEWFHSSVRSYVHFLEEVVIATCAHFGVDVGRSSENPGVWAGDAKIAAIGVRVKDKVTKHGLAFNVNNSLSTFAAIVPCGLRTSGVTTLEREIQKIRSSQETCVVPALGQDVDFFSEVRALIMTKLEERLSESVQKVRDLKNGERAGGPVARSSSDAPQSLGAGL